MWVVWAFLGMGLFLVSLYGLQEFASRSTPRRDFRSDETAPGERERPAWMNQKSLLDSGYEASVTPRPAATTRATAPNKTETNPCDPNDHKSLPSSVEQRPSPSTSLVRKSEYATHDLDSVVLAFKPAPAEPSSTPSHYAASLLNVPGREVEQDPHSHAGSHPADSTTLPEGPLEIRPPKLPDHRSCGFPVPTPVTEGYWNSLRELHYITPISNVPSILRNGIQSYNSAQKYSPDTVAMPEVNQRRHHRQVANGWTVHDHANLYFNARNPMMYKRKDHHQSLCVLRVSADVLSEQWIAITDGNAASISTHISIDRKTAFDYLDYDVIFGDRWDDIPDGRRRRCAEVLVLHKVEPRFITGAYVSCEASQRLLWTFAPSLDSIVNEHMFFYRGDWVRYQ